MIDNNKIIFKNNNNNKRRKKGNETVQDEQVLEKVFANTLFYRKAIVTYRFFSAKNIVMINSQLSSYTP
jgi:hypothetical protein